MNRKERRARGTLGPAGPARGSDPRALLRDAVQHHQAGRAREAAALYDRVLATDPDQPDALHLSGILLAQTGRPDAGETRLARAVAREPRRAEFHANHGQVLAMLGRHADAEAALRTAIGLDVRQADAHNNLGNVLKAQGRHADAVAAYRAAVAARPDFAGAWSNLGNLLSDGGDAEAAEAALRKAIALAPDNAGVHNNLGALLRQTGDMAGAIESLERALERDPELADAHEHLGALHAQAGRLAEALEHFDAALARKPDDLALRMNMADALRRAGRLDAAEPLARAAVAAAATDPAAHRVLGAVLRGQHRLAEAEAVLRHALDLAPDDPATLGQLGLTLNSQGRLGDAIACYERALDRRPGDAPTQANLAVCLLNQGRIAEAIDMTGRALEGADGDARAASNLLMASNYGDAAPEELFRTHCEVAVRHIAPPACARPAAPHGPDRVLRVGFVSPDLRRHSVAYFLAPLLAALDRSCIHVTCFANVARADDVTDRLRAASDAWVDVAALDDAALVAAVRAANIDILVDLAGHTRRNRLGAFAARAAPVQLTWLGYPNTTGLDSIDYRLTDAVADPPGQADALHSETLLRLPGGFLCYGPPEDAPAVAPLPAGNCGPVTFASFNNWSKAGPESLDLWAGVLEAVPNSQLYLRARALADPETRARCLAAFADRGIEADRLRIAGWHADPNAALADYANCDIALDTTPYNGTTTTCEALWMGVPMIALRGGRHASRVGASLLTQVGLDEWIADDPAGYIAAAARLAGDRARLAALRAGLRDRVAASPLCDRDGFARRFEDALRTIWRDACTGADGRG
jgi:protein O-GlcNAc transferase